MLVQHFGFDLASNAGFFQHLAQDRILMRFKLLHLAFG